MVEALRRLEIQVKQLLDELKRAGIEGRRLQNLVLEQTSRASELEKQLIALKKQLDVQGSDRFKLAKMREERERLREIVDQALARLATLQESD